MLAIRQSLKEFCKETSIVGFQYLVNPTRTVLEKCSWFLLQCFLLGISIVLIWETIEGFVEDPLVTSMESSRYPIGEVQFPAVAICNINKISRKRAEDLAALITARKPNARYEEVLNNMEVLGNLYDNEVDNGANRLLEFQTILESYGNVDLKNRNYLYHFMKNLSAPCDELLVSCYWEGIKQNCAEMFHLRRTYEGFCCAFNYIRPFTEDINIDFKIEKKPKRLKKAGRTQGLTVVVNNDCDDYFYPLISSIGVSIQIFDPLDYPDEASGGLIKELVGMGTETFIDLNANTVYAVPDVRNYPLAIRQCIFEDEVKTKFGIYSLSNCLVECRVKSILALCKCIPFLVPGYINSSLCTLADIPCLNKYQGKWNTIYPLDNKFQGLEEEEQNALYCSKCLSKCDGTSYAASSSWANIYVNNEKDDHHENVSVIRIFWAHRFTNLYKLDVQFYWYELLGNIGGVLGIFLGISIINIIEFIYYITIRAIVLRGNAP